MESLHCSLKSLVQFHTATLIAVSKHRQISSLKASRQLKEATADNTMCFLCYNRKNRKKLISSLHFRGFPSPQKFFPTTDSFKTSQGTWPHPDCSRSLTKIMENPGKKAFQGHVSDSRQGRSGWETAWSKRMDEWHCLMPSLSYDSSEKVTLSEPQNMHFSISPWANALSQT